MTGPRSYSAPTRAALALLSRGRCYNPDCGRPDPIIVERTGTAIGSVSGSNSGEAVRALRTASKDG